MHLKFRQSILSLIPSLAVISFLFASCSSENYEEIVTVSIKDGVLGDPVDIDVPSDLFRSSSDMSPFKTSSSSIASGKSSDSKTDSSDSSVKPVSSSSIDVPKSSASQASSSSQKTETPASALPPAGFYSAFTLTAPTPKNGGVIRCTYDGSEPTSATAQASNKNISSTTAVRCYEFIGNDIVAKETQTYFINETISMPVVAISVAPEYFNGYVAAPKCSPDPCYSAKFWEDVEYPVHVEYFANGSRSTQKDFEIDAGISIMGGWSRNQIKKSVSIAMRKEYQEGRLKYPLFDTHPEKKKFKAFNLRNNGNRFWTDYFGDPMLVSLMEGTEVDYQRSRQVVVFYNGEYFGIHDMRERLNRSFAETNYGVDSKSINVVKNCSNGDEGYQNGWCPSGTNGASANEFAQLVNTITSGNFEGENNQQYEEVKKKLNISSFAQYMIAEMYIHNGDWPNNNIRFWGSPANGQPFKAMIFDVDHGYGFSPGITGFDTESQNMFQWVLGSATMDNNNGGNQGGNQGGIGGIGGFGGGMGGWGMGSTTTLGNMLKKLLANPDFKRLFINQSCILLNSYLTYEKVQAAVQNMLATIPSSEQSRDEQRWPRNQSSFTWAPSGSDLLRFAQNRTETTRQELANYFGLSGEVSVTLSASGNGKIYVDEMALPSTTYQGKFLAGNPLKLTAVAVSGGVFTGWSDGSTENPRLVEPSAGMTLTAQFK